MKIINQSKNTVLATKVFYADTFFKRAKGLLGRKSFNFDEALVIFPCSSVHTFFMRFPIDVLFIDKNNRVIKKIANLLPFRIVPFCSRSRLVVELPKGTLSRYSIDLGDILALK